jgi:hypothetical protein
LYWADDLSLAVLMALVRRAAVSRYGVIGSLRLSPRPAALDGLLEVVRDGGGRHARLDSLDERAGTIDAAHPAHELRTSSMKSSGGRFARRHPSSRQASL